MGTSQTYMFRKVRGFGEGPFAIRALERLVSVVRALVDSERSRDCEGLAAPRVVAHIWF